MVVEARGHVITKSGVPFDYTYCHVFRLAEGGVREVTEYCDTQLVAAALGNPEGATEGEPVVFRMNENIERDEGTGI